uniref:Uncharacterized protein n=1 Tax=Tetraselmis sp. GSL018 TaxID=582737 RepID=A0A061RIU6_9CHLO
MEISVSTAQELREAICFAQGGVTILDSPRQCAQNTSESSIKINLRNHIDLEGRPLPILKGSVVVAGQCGDSLDGMCRVNAVDSACSSCLTPNEGIRVGLDLCEACNTVAEPWRTVPFWIGKFAKVWLSNISIRGCRSERGGGCLFAEAGDSAVWGLDRPQPMLSRLTFLHARGRGGGFELRQGVLAVMEDVALEKNHAAADGRAVGAGTTHDGAVDRYAALIATNPRPPDPQVSASLPMLDDGPEPLISISVPANEGASSGSWFSPAERPSPSAVSGVACAGGAGRRRARSKRCKRGSAKSQRWTSIRCGRTRAAVQATMSQQCQGLPLEEDPRCRS